MNESKQDKQPTWRRHLQQGVAGVMIAASVGCAKTPEEELRETAYAAAEACKTTPASKDKRGRKRDATMYGAVQVSIPCEMANDKAAIDREVAAAAKACANPGKDRTTLYYQNDFIASCTRVQTPEVPLWNAFGTSAAASAPEKVKPAEKNPSFAERAASAAAAADTSAKR